MSGGKSYGPTQIDGRKPVDHVSTRDTGPQFKNHLNASQMASQGAVNKAELTLGAANEKAKISEEAAEKAWQKVKEAEEVRKKRNNKKTSEELKQAKYEADRLSNIAITDAKKVSEIRGKEEKLSSAAPSSPSGKAKAAPPLPPVSDKKSRLDEKSPPVDSAVETYVKGLMFNGKTISALESMSAKAKKDANKYAQMLNNPVTFEESKTRQTFFAKVEETASELRKNGKSEQDIEAEKQKMFNEELMKYIAEEAQKSEKKAQEDVEKKKAEQIQKQAEHQALESFNNKFQMASGASAAVDGIGSLVVAPADFMTGLAKFLNESAPAGHANEFLLMVKFFETFASLVKLPFDLLKSSLDVIAMQNANSGQKEAYKKYIEAKPEERYKTLPDIEKANQKTIEESEKRAREAYENANPGKYDGVGGPGDNSSTPDRG